MEIKRARGERQKGQSARQKTVVQSKLLYYRSLSFESLEERQLLSANSPEIGWQVGEEKQEANRTGDFTTSVVAENTASLAEISYSQDGSLYHPPRTSLYELGSFLTPPSDAAPLDVALDYLSSKAGDLGLTAGDLDNYLVTDQYVSEHTGVTHIYLRQMFDGLEIVGADININITTDGQVINVGSSFLAGLGSSGVGIATLSQPKLTAGEALESLSAQMGWTLDASPVAFGHDPSGDTGTTTLLTASSVSSGAIPAELHYVPTPDGGVELAWNLIVETVDGRHWYNSSVSAHQGELIFQSDWIDDAAYKVYAIPSENPIDGSRTVEADPSFANASPFGWHDTNGVAGAEFTDTRGNNVFAQEDRDGTGSSNGARPDGGAGLNFDFSLNLGLEPEGYQDASITNLFYWNNLLHDIHYEYGFDELAGNFQKNNYGNGGLGNDQVNAQAQFGADQDNFNNAFFGTPPDGSEPIMGMLEFTYSSPRRDSDLDNVIIVHEYGHGVSNRLTGGPSNSDALIAIQSGGMGEGWGDWWGLMLTQKPTDAQLDAYSVGTYVLNQSPTGTGIRRYPYSYDMSVNPLTYGNIRSHSEVHDSGEIWASALWDLNWLLINGGGAGMPAYGFDTDLYGGTGGNNLAMQLVMDGLKLQPANPSFLEARDAILQADQVAYGGANQLAIWAAFARRGMGYSAYDGGSSNSTNNVEEAFDLPATSAGQVDFDAESYEVGEVVTVTVRDLDLLGGGPINVPVVSSGGDSETVSLSELGGGIFQGTISTSASGTSGNGTLNIKSGNIITVTYNDADNGTGNPVVVDDTADIFLLERLFIADFSNLGAPDLDGFSIDNTGASVAGLWHLSTGRGADLNHTGNDSIYFGTGEGPNGGGNFNVGDTAGRITSPQIDLTNADSPQLSFNYFLKTEDASPFYDVARVRISASGGPFKHLASNADDLIDPTSEWTSAAYDLSPFVGGVISIQFDFNTHDSVLNNFEGWYIDDVVVTGLPLPPPPLAIQTLTPADGGLLVAENANLIATFNQQIQKGVGNITIKRSSDDSTFAMFDVNDPQVTIDGTAVIVNPDSDLASLTGYYVLLDSDAIQGLGENSYEGIASSNDWNFTTADTSSLLFHDYFPTTTYDPAKWSMINNAAIDTTGIGEPTGQHSARLNGHPNGGDQLESAVIDLSGFASAELHYYYQPGGGGDTPDANEDLILEYKHSIGIWIEFDLQMGGNLNPTGFVESTAALPPSAFHSNFQFRFRSVGDSNPILQYDDWFIDDIKLVDLPPSITVDTQFSNDPTPEITGTVDDPYATISVDIGSQVGITATNNGDGTWTVPDNIITTLPNGTYEVVATATDSSMNIGTDTTSNELSIDTEAPLITVDSLSTTDSTPALTGTVDDSTATISVSVGGQIGLAAINNGDGTWTLPNNTLVELPDDTYNVVATASDATMNIGADSTTDELTVDVIPTISIDPQLTNDTTPTITGRVDDPAATISVDVGVQVGLVATNNGDGTWILPDNALAELLDGTYDVVVRATDVTLNIGTDTTSNELSVDAALIFFDFFPTATFNPTKWSTIENATIDKVGISEPTAPNAVRFNGNPDGADQIKSVVIDLSNMSDIDFSYHYQLRGGGESPDAGDDLILEYKNNSGIWIELGRQYGSGQDMSSFAEKTFALPEDALHSNFQFRLRSIGSPNPTNIYDDWFIDDIKIIEFIPDADFDEDDNVDGSDFLTWQLGFGTVAPGAARADGDADGDQDVDEQDFNTWESQFGEFVPAASVTSPLEVVMNDSSEHMSPKVTTAYSSAGATVVSSEAHVFTTVEIEGSTIAPAAVANSPLRSETSIPSSQRTNFVDTTDLLRGLSANNLLRLTSPNRWSSNHLSTPLEKLSRPTDPAEHLDHVFSDTWELFNSPSNYQDTWVRELAKTAQKGRSSDTPRETDTVFAMLADDDMFARQ